MARRIVYGAQLNTRSELGAASFPGGRILRGTGEAELLTLRRSFPQRGVDNYFSFVYKPSLNCDESLVARP
jgi:hypothetical protein